MLPAYAGMILVVDPDVVVGFGAPRVCGDDPQQPARAGGSASCSPRMRG